MLLFQETLYSRLRTLFSFAWLRQAEPALSCFSFKVLSASSLLTKRPSSAAGVNGAGMLALCCQWVRVQKLVVFWLLQVWEQGFSCELFQAHNPRTHMRGVKDRRRGVGTAIQQANIQIELSRRTVLRAPALSQDCILAAAGGNRNEQRPQRSSKVVLPLVDKLERASSISSRCASRTSFRDPAWIIQAQPTKAKSEGHFWPSPRARPGRCCDACFAMAAHVRSCSGCGLHASKVHVIGAICEHRQNHS